MSRRSLIVCSLFGAMLLGSPPYAVAQADREQQLEDLVRRLSEQVERLEKRIDDLERSRGDQTTQERVEKLEESVEKIKTQGPLQVDPADWEKIKKWATASNTLRPFWKEGLRFESNDGSVKLKLGGRIQVDSTYFVEDGKIERRLGKDFDDGSEFRRTRLYMAGTLDKDIEFKAQYDFAGGDADFKDVYLGFKNVAHVGNVRIGQFKEPFSLEELTSSNYITFLERSLVNVFAPGRQVGVMFHDTMYDKRMTWAAGIFRQSDSFGDSLGDGVGGRDFDATLRVTGLPVYEDKGEKLLHLGLAYSHRNYDDDRVRFRARPEVHQSPRVLNTGHFQAEYGDFIGAEVALVNGPFSLQGEYVHAFIQGRVPRIGDPRFWAASVQASYFLTGEHRPYKTSSGSFGRVIPLHNYTKDGGPGAWELAARYSYLNLNDGRVKGGRLSNLTLGVNWYLNPSVRTMWNYVLADPSFGGNISAFLWRVQIAF